MQPQLNTLGISASMIATFCKQTLVGAGGALFIPLLRQGAVLNMLRYGQPSRKTLMLQSSSSSLSRPISVTAYHEPGSCCICTQSMHKHCRHSHASDRTFSWGFSGCCQQRLTVIYYNTFRDSPIVDVAIRSRLVFHRLKGGGRVRRTA